MILSKPAGRPRNVFRYKGINLARESAEDWRDGYRSSCMQNFQQGERGGDAVLPVRKTVRTSTNPALHTQDRNQMLKIPEGRALSAIGIQRSVCRKILLFCRI